MLLNEFLKEHRKVEEQGATIVQQQKAFEAKFAQQQKQIEALTATVGKSQRASRPRQTCTTVSRQPLKAAGLA